MMPEPDHTNLPATDETEAQRRFQEHEHCDPLPEVNPALLNSGDIYDYTCITGMIYPFPESEQQLKEKLKSASYEVDFLGTVYSIDDQGNYRYQTIESGTPFKLQKNSIAYICLATKFRLPDYIALRFNLKITHVHRGLLLGTGPLVDAGFCGNLLVPLHNLTSKDYTLKGGDGLIWVEFTKLSHHRSWSRAGRRDSYAYFPFPPKKRHLTAQQYFNKATEDGLPAESSIPGEILVIKDAAENARVGAENARTEARSANREAENARKFSQNLLTYGSLGTIIAVVSIVAGAIAIAIASWDLVHSASNDVTELRTELNGEMARIEKKLSEAQEVIDKMTVEVKAMQTSKSTKDAVSAKGK